MSSLSLHTPWALFLLLVPLSFMLYSWRARKKSLDYADEALRPWALLGQPRLNIVRQLLHVAGWLGLLIALAGPRQHATHEVEVSNTRHDVHILALLDVSDSMLAEDIPPSHLERAMQKLDTLPDKLHGESLGLAVFAGNAGVVVPPSHDPALFRHALQGSRQLLQDSPGSDLALALEQSIQALQNDPAHAKALLLVTDGDADMFANPAVMNAAERLHQAGIPLFVLGIGTQEGAAIPDGAGGYRQVDDAPYISRLDRESLTRMAQLTSGKFIPVSDGDTDLLALSEAISTLPSHATPAPSLGWHDLATWPLLLGLTMLLLAYTPMPRKPHPAGMLTLLPLCTLVLALLPFEHLAAEPTQTQTTLAEAYAAWTREDFVKAQQLYARLAGVQARMGEGAAAYRRGDFEHAARAFTTAWMLAGSDAQRADALYNLGNAEYSAGRPERAVVAYESVLALRPNDENAMANLWLAQQQSEARRVKKSRPEDPPGRKPTDFARYDENVASDMPTEQAAPGTGLSSAEASKREAQTGQTTQALRLQDADRMAAEKKMEFLDDSTLSVWRAMLRSESPAGSRTGLPW